MKSTLEADALTARRQAMVAVQLQGRGIADQRLLDAMGRVPRHEFVAPQHHPDAYGDHPLPIAEGQTISQPYMVALTLEALELAPTDRVLEVGTGSGYEAALLAELAAQVYTIERHPALFERARDTLKRLGYANITGVLGDGSKGLAQFAPFNAIAVSAAAPRIPAALAEQLAEGGRLAVPVGSVQLQELQLVRKRGGQLVTTIVEMCRFVPLIGEQGFPG